MGQGGCRNERVGGCRVLSGIAKMVSHNGVGSCRGLMAHGVGGKVAGCRRVSVFSGKGVKHGFQWGVTGCRWGCRGLSVIVGGRHHEGLGDCR